MTPGGWINMILSVGFVVGLFSWCLYRLFGPTGRQEERDHLARVEPIEKDRIHDR